MKTAALLLFFMLAFYCPCNLFAQLPAKKIAVVVDERIELITTMQLLFEYPLVGQADIKYKQEALNYFAKHKNDTSVNYFLNIAQKYLSFVRPINYAYHFSFPGFKQTVTLSAAENENLGFAKHSADSLKLYINALKDFYTDANFHAFYEQHRAFYDSLIKAPH